MPEKRYKKTKRIAIIEAFLLTAFIYGVLFFAFGYSEVKYNKVDNENVSVTLYNTSNLSARERADFSEFVKQNDPRLMTQSNIAGAFDNEINLYKKDFKDINLELSDQGYMRNLPAINTKNSITPFVLEEDKFINNLSGFYYNTIKDTKGQHYPFAMSSNGEIISLFFDQEKVEFLKKYRLNNTIIQVNKNRDNLFNFDIVESSGKRDFDLLALKMLAKEVLNKLTTVDGTIYTIYYQEEKYD